MTGKAANWRQACAALIRILGSTTGKSSETELDHLVSEEIDGLAKVAIRPGAHG